ncbi:MAG: hypothetical protein KAH23_00725 [Kiritimatiellae bacterium]|nr:hypothetical protein [Kiritimatiellia bacterium]
MSAGSALIKKTRWRILNIGRVLRAQSLFKVLFIIVFALAFEAGLWLLFLDGFKFLDQLGGIGLLIIGKMFSVFFLGMGLMLIVSSVVTSYATIFRSREIPFLVSRPFHFSQIIAYKFLESTALSSWAFFFIIVPFVGAYAQHSGLSMFFAFWTFMFSIPFLLICSGIGTLVTLIFVRWFPSGRIGKICVWTIISILLLLFCGLMRGASAQVSEFQFNLANLVPGLRLASNPLLPNWWIAEGIMRMARGQWSLSLFLLALSSTTAMMIFMTVEQVGRMIFYDVWQRVLGSHSNSKRSAVLMPWMENVFSFLSRNTRGMIIKDIRSFLRDPMQWSQALVFFGILAIYFANIRTFNYHLLPLRWRNIIAFLNVFSVSAVMCSLGSRFIYPQLSLEGQGFWILGLSPVSMKRIVLSKFFMALICMLAVSTTLMMISTGMLRTSPTIKTVAVCLACAMSCAISGLSTGLGAIFMDLDQRNPAAIVSGFGGTFNLVLTLGFMLIAILPFGLAFHAETMGYISSSQMQKALFLSSLILITLTAIATITPLVIGIKSLKHRDF